MAYSRAAGIGTRGHGAELTRGTDLDSVRTPVTNALAAAMDLASPDLQPLSFRKGAPDDVDCIVRLVNSAYRGDTSRLGWTTEADLLDGQRTDAEEVSGLIAPPHSYILLAVGEGETVGSVHLHRTEASASLGMFAIRPGLQGSGIGKRLMAAAEMLVREEWNIGTMRMTVITLRHELIAFYERRGYRRTGEFVPFPVSHRFGIPRVSNLQLEVMVKALG